MELPHLGKNCSEKSCNKLDFLPINCDGCDKIFCCEHYSYAKHSCPGLHKKDVQVPVCPLCGEPVPTPRGVPADRTVGDHIDQYCKSETKKIFTNQCTYKNCKKKELIPVNCSVCKKNFCLRHRHSTDHECKGPQSAKKNMAAAAAENRRASKPASLFTSINKTMLQQADGGATPRVAASRQLQSNIQNIQGNMTEDEALARALALSILELDESADRNRRNQQQANVPPVVSSSTTTASSSKDKCSLS